MTPDASIAVVEAFWEEVWAAANPGAIYRFVTDDFIFTSAGVDVVGPDAFKIWVAGFQSKIGELKWETIETFANPDGSRVSSLPDHRSQQRHVSGCPPMASQWHSPATPSWPSRPPASWPGTGSSAAPGSSTTS